MAKIKDGRERESEGSERRQGWDGDKLASRRWQVWPGKGERVPNNSVIPLMWETFPIESSHPDMTSASGDTKY